jgi:hypothetical protein
MTDCGSKPTKQFVLAISRRRCLVVIPHALKTEIMIRGVRTVSQHTKEAGGIQIVIMLI